MQWTSGRMYGATAEEIHPQEQTNGLKRISSDLTVLSRSLDGIGSLSDSTGLRASIKTLRSQLKREIREEQVRQMNTKQVKSEQQKRNANQLHSYVTSLHQLMRQESTLIQNHPIPRSIAEEEPDWGGTTAVPLLQQNVHGVISNADELEELQRDIEDLAELMKLFPRMVAEQGEDINNIEANVGSARDKVERGNRELQEAAKLKGSTRRKKCCIGVCVTVTIVIPLLLLALLIALLVVFLHK